MSSNFPLLYISNIDINDMENNSQRFMRVLDGLSKVMTGEKLRIKSEENEEKEKRGNEEKEKEKKENGEKVFEVDSSYFQSVVRWYYGFNRTQTYLYLVDILDDYFKFLNMLEAIYKNDKNSTDPKRENLLQTIETHNEFSKSCIKGLFHLSETYKNDVRFKNLYEKYDKMI